MGMRLRTCSHLLFSEEKLTSKTDLEVLEEALDVEEFDVLSFVEGTTTPEDTVDIYTSAKAAYKLASLYEKEKLAAKAREEARKSKVQSLSLTDEEFYLDEDEVDALTEELNASKLTFTLRGMLPVEIIALTKGLQATLPYVEGADNDEYNREVNGQIYVRTVQSITDARGRVQTKRMTVGGMYKLLDSLYPDQRIKLETAIWHVTSIANAFTQAVTADFS